MKTRLRELALVARGSQDAGSRNLVFTFQLSTVDAASELVSQVGEIQLPIYLGVEILYLLSGQRSQHIKYKRELSSSTEFGNELHSFGEPTSHAFSVLPLSRFLRCISFPTLYFLGRKLPSS